MRIWKITLSFCLAFISTYASNDSTIAVQSNIEMSDSLFEEQFIKGTAWADELDSIHCSELYSISCFAEDPSCLNVHGFHPDSVPVWSKEVIEQRLKALDGQTPIALDFNTITHKFILFYANKRRTMVSRVLGLQERYYPLFEQELEKEGLPIELAHLAVVESALTSDIRSRAGAVGLWQFMYRTGKYFGLEINSYVDERMDPIASTKTAVRYLKYLHGLYDDWHMALAAYNAGPGNVNKAIRRSGGKKTYWEIYDYLPRETRGYVPAFIAVNYIMNHAADHNIYPLKPRFLEFEVDTINVKSEVSLEQISEVTCISMDDLNYLNPKYKLGIVPNIDGKTYAVCLPKNEVGTFIALEEDVYEYVLPKDIDWDEQTNEALVKEERKQLKHKVRSGESIGLIAQKYGVSKSDIRSWNNISKKELIHPGQVLTVYSNKTVQQKNVASVSNRIEKGYIYHTIRNGDTLWDIAKMYEGVSVSSLRKLNNLSKNHVLKPGEKIKIKKS